jgi:hypothetical protein
VNQLDPLKLIVATAQSPDGRIMAKVSDGDRVELRFRARTFPGYEAGELGNQLSHLATRLWAEYQRSYYRALSEAVGEDIRDSERETSPRAANFRKAQAELKIEATSPRKEVRLVTVGLMRWQVRVAPGIGRRLTEEAFLDEISRTLRALLAAYYDRVLQLRDTYFDLKLSKESTPKVM